MFGKTMENLRNRVDVQLVHNRKKLLKRVSKSSFERCEIFNNGLVGVQCKKNCSETEQTNCSGGVHFRTIQNVSCMIITTITF